METHEFFLYLLVILLTARVFAELATRLMAPSVIGELFAGIVLGPSLLGWIEPLEAIRLMAELGIILLLFEVGLGTDVKRLVRTGLKSFIVAIAGFVLPLVTSART
jgi:Kef-type K+ transport system membrane component KefB